MWSSCNIYRALIHRWQVFFSPPPPTSEVLFFFLMFFFLLCHLNFRESQRHWNICRGLGSGGRLPSFLPPHPVFHSHLCPPLPRFSPGLSVVGRVGLDWECLGLRGWGSLRKVQGACWGARSHEDSDLAGFSEGGLYTGYHSYDLCCNFCPIIAASASSNGMFITHQPESKQFRNQKASSVPAGPHSRRRGNRRYCRYRRQYTFFIPMPPDWYSSWNLSAFV